MNRKDTTKLLTDILIFDMPYGSYYAKEVVLDWGYSHPKRIDVMRFIPNGVMNISDIEKGIFICYEIKSCMDDIYSGNGLNFYGEKNYIVTTMETYKKFKEDVINGKFKEFMKEKHPDVYKADFGVLVPVPANIDLRKTKELYAEYENPTELGGDSFDWKLAEMSHCHGSSRKRSMTELLFCMLRAKNNNSNSN